MMWYTQSVPIDAQTPNNRGFTLPYIRASEHGDWHGALRIRIARNAMRLLLDSRNSVEGVVETLVHEMIVNWKGAHKYQMLIDHVVFNWHVDLLPLAFRIIQTIARVKDWSREVYWACQQLPGDTSSILHLCRHCRAQLLDRFHVRKRKSQSNCYCHGFEHCHQRGTQGLPCP